MGIAGVGRLEVRVFGQNFEQAAFVRGHGIAKARAGAVVFHVQIKAGRENLRQIPALDEAGHGGGQAGVAAQASAHIYAPAARAGREGEMRAGLDAAAAVKAGFAVNGGLAADELDGVFRAGRGARGGGIAFSAGEFARAGRGVYLRPPYGDKAEVGDVRI